MLCPNCRSELEESDRFCSSCGAKVRELDMEKAGAGTRFVSYIIDSMIVGAICLLPRILNFNSYAITDELEPILHLVLVALIDVGYFTYFFGKGQTPGMKAMAIQLCGTDGTYPIGYEKGSLRWIGMVISEFVMGLGFLWILIDKNNQGWHDKIAGTYVVLEKKPNKPPMDASDV